MPDRSFLDLAVLRRRGTARWRRELEAWCRERTGRSTTDDVDAACRELVRAARPARLAANRGCRADGGENGARRAIALPDPRNAGAASGLADFAFAMQGLGSGPICLFGSERAAGIIYRGRGAGAAIAAFAISEPDAGSDVAAWRPRRERDGNGFVIDGEKTWISNAGIADYYVVFARTGEAPGAKGLSRVRGGRRHAGPRVAERIEVIAPHPLAHAQVQGLPGAARTRMIGEPGKGFKVAMATLDIFRSTVGAAALGFARRALDEALDARASRQLFGAPLGRHADDTGALADMALDIDAAALLVYRAAWARDRAPSASRARPRWPSSSRPKRRSRSSTWPCSSSAAAGWVRRPVERLYREMRALRIY